MNKHQHCRRVIMSGISKSFIAKVRPLAGWHGGEGTFVVSFVKLLAYGSLLEWLDSCKLVTR